MRHQLVTVQSARDPILRRRSSVKVPERAAPEPVPLKRPEYA